MREAGPSRGHFASPQATPLDQDYQFSFCAALGADAGTASHRRSQQLISHGRSPNGTHFETTVYLRTNAMQAHHSIETQDISCCCCNSQRTNTIVQPECGNERSAVCHGAAVARRDAPPHSTTTNITTDSDAFKATVSSLRGRQQACWIVGARTGILNNLSGSRRWQKRLHQHSVSDAASTSGLAHTHSLIIQHAVTACW